MAYELNINPLKENYYAYNLDGVDYKFTLKDIPLFWKNRISKIDINNNLNEELDIQHHLYSIIQMIYSDIRYNPYIDKEVETNAYGTREYVIKKGINKGKIAK